MREQPQQPLRTDGYLTLNPQTGKYEGLFIQVQKVEVDADVYRNMFIQAIREEDETTDLTRPHELSERLSRVTNWLHKPNVKITPLSIQDVMTREGVAEERKDTPPLSTQQPPQEKKERIGSEAGGEKTSFQRRNTKDPGGKTQMELMEEDLRRKAIHIAPYLWEQHLLVPYHTSTKDIPKDQMAREGRTRYEQRQILKKLRREVEAGTFTLDEDAELAEMEHEEEQASKLTGKIVAVAGAVNGNGFH